MTNSDKTRQKLVNSMRKSKDAAAKKPAQKADAAMATPAPRKYSKKSKSAAAAPAPAAARSRSPSRPQSALAAVRPGSGDPYQYGRRVWPD